MNVRINVTQDKIKKGKPGNCWKCPISLAFNDVLKPGYYCVTELGKFTIKKDGRAKYELIFGSGDNKIHCDFIWAFDDELPVKPLSFAASIPDQYLKRSVLAKAKKKR